jgi:hypothetical protein
MKYNRKCHGLSAYTDSWKNSSLLSDLKTTNKISLVFLDSDINLLNLNQQEVSQYLDCIFENSYLQIVSKATRIQRDSKTLKDHILTNSRTLNICAGTFVSDVSDHFFTFVMHFFEPASRDFSHQNMLGFRNELGMADWTNVANKLNVDEAYEEFWNTYNGLYSRFLQLKGAQA